MRVMTHRTNQGAHAGKRDAYQGHKSLCLFSLPKPIGQVQNNARKISGLCEAEEKTSDVKLIGGLHKPSQGSHRNM